MSTPTDRPGSSEDFEVEPDALTWLQAWYADQDEWTDGFVEIDSDRWVAEGWGAALRSVADWAEEPPTPDDA